jgi:hypothetical protein
LGAGDENIHWAMVAWVSATGIRLLNGKAPMVFQAN